MKTRLLLTFLVLCGNVFSQSINDYKAVVVPLKYDFLKQNNQYRLNSITKMNLEKAGFKAFYLGNVPAEYSDRCSLLNVDVKSDSNLFVTKLYVVFSDCNGKEIYKSPLGKSREKEFEKCYAEALNDAFTSIYALNYKYSGGQTSVAESTETKPDTNTETLYAQATPLGFQLIDSTPKVVMKIFKTTNSTCYIAYKDNKQGVLILVNSDWIFEYIENDKLYQEKILVKF